MILGLKRQIISRLLQVSKLKLKEIPNLQEIHQCLEDNLLFCQVEKNKPDGGKVLRFRPGYSHDTSLKLIRCSWNTNSEVSNDSGFLHIAPNVLAETVLTDIYEQAENYGKNQAIEFKKYFNGISYVNIPKNENVVVEIRNESIANPFHADHLKNIMIGRFLTNISMVFNKNVTFVNYLHDWTVMIDALVYKRHNLPFKGRKDDLFHLLALADVFEEIPLIPYEEFNNKMFKQAVTFMTSLERGDQKALEIWQKCKDIYVNDHEKMYQRLGIKFDATYAESQYTEQANQIFSLVKKKNPLLGKEGKELIDVSDTKPSYLDYSNRLRLIAAAVDRFNTYSADRIIYVTFEGFCRFNVPLIVKELRPGQPGRIEDYSTGFMNGCEIDSPKLSKMLDEFMNSKTAIMLKHKLWEDNESLRDVTDKLSICQFAMKNLVVMKNGYTSSKNVNESFGNHEYAALQHSHVRLCRLIKLYNDNYSFKSIDFNLLSEDCAIRLIQHLARYHEILIRSYVELQSIHLVHYLINLMRLERLAYEELLLFNQTKKIRDARLTLFMCTRQVLANGMNILGIQPLGKI